MQINSYETMLLHRLYCLRLSLSHCRLKVPLLILFLSLRAVPQSGTDSERATTYAEAEEPCSRRTEYKPISRKVKDAHTLAIQLFTKSPPAASAGRRCCWYSLAFSSVAWFITERSRNKLDPPILALEWLRPKRHWAGCGVRHRRADSNPPRKKKMFIFSGADSMRHGRGGGTCPHFYKWLCTGSTVSRRTANTKLTKLYWPSWWRSPKRLIVLLEPKSGDGGTTKTFFPALCARSVPQFRSGPVLPTFKFVPAPLFILFIYLLK